MAAPEPIATYNGGVEPQLDATITISGIVADGDDGTVLQGQDTTVEGILYTNGTLTYQLPDQTGGGVNSLTLFARSVSAEGAFGQSVSIGTAAITDTGQTYEGEEVYDWSANVSTATLSAGIYDLEAFAYTSITASDPNFPVASFSNTNNHPAFEYFNVVPSDDGTLPPAPIAADAGSGELSTDGQYFVYTSNSQTYELDIQTGDQIELAAGEAPIGNFAPGQTIDSAALTYESGAGNDLGSLVFDYSHTITSANGAYTLGAIGEDHPYIAQAYQPYMGDDYYTPYDAELFPVVTDNATGLTTLLTGFGTQDSVDDSPEGIPVAISDDGTTVLVENDYLDGLGNEAGSGYTIVHLPAAPGTPSGDVFSDVSAAASGALAGEYLWSNPGNWSQGEPVDGSSATLDDNGIDDLASLSLAMLVTNEQFVSDDGGLLTVDTLVTDSDSGIVAASPINGGADSGSIVIGTVSGAGALFLTDGADASLNILDPAEPDEIYQDYTGGRIVLDALTAGSAFGFVGAATLALVLPDTDTAALIEGLSPSDVLELPGTTVLGASFGAHDVDITTSSGIYEFTNVTFGAAIAGFTEGLDPATGLEAITFASSPQPDIFIPRDQATFSIYTQYLWSDPRNWSGGPPVTGDSVIMNAGVGLDDIDSVSLSSLTLGSSATLDVTGEHLTIGDLTGGGILIAQGGLLIPDVTLTVDADTVTGDTAPIYGADGPGAVFIDSAAFTSGILFADGGGLLELTGVPGAAQLNYSASFLGYYNGPSTIAFLQPGATVAAPLDFVSRQDVLELPGTAVSGVEFGTASLTISTNEGTTTFTNVDYADSLTGYTASFDTLTGLEAITFTGPAGLDVFDGAAVQAVPRR